MITATITGGDRLTGYNYFWVKAVTGFRPNQHCAKCLTGAWLHVTATAWPMERPVWLDLGGAPFGYLCGVAAAGYGWNLHAPFAPDPDASFTVDLIHGQHLHIDGARRLPIPALPPDWKGLSRAFTTCRNFQWAVATFGAAGVRGRVTQGKLDITP